MNKAVYTATEVTCGDQKRLTKHLGRSGNAKPKSL